jgi:3-keto-disaccharide hydrolase
MAHGYTDTPIIPGTQWHVHDSDRPQPPVITPTNLSQISPVTPPSDATVLFDGSSLDEWENAKTGEPAGWKLVDGCMEVVRKSGNIRSKKQFGDMQLHVEWAAPSEVESESQGRGNSGVFLMGLYEIQVLDCYDNPTYADGGTAGVYGQYPPLVNACCKPGEFHVYDILWKAPRFEGGKLKSPAFVTIMHNGVCVHHAVELQGPTLHKEATSYDTPHDATGPIILQDHGNPVRFRNIWMRELKDYDQG